MTRFENCEISRFVSRRREKKLEQLDRAETLLRNIDVSKTYNYEFVCYRVTTFRPEKSPIMPIKGADLRHDIHLFIEDLSESADVKAEEISQPVLTVDELSKRFNVSTKTISRWRLQGLVSRKFIFDGGRKRIGFLHSSVDTFVKLNKDKVKRGERFSQLSKQEKNDIVECARRLAKAGGCPAEVTRQIADTMSRSVETIRYTIRQFDEQNPDLAIFPDQTGPMNLEIKERVYHEFLSGRAVEQIAKRYCRTKTTIYRVVNEMRAMAIMELPLDFMDNPEFHRRGFGQTNSPVGVSPFRKRSHVGRGRQPACLATWLRCTRRHCSHVSRKLGCSESLTT